MSYRPSKGSGSIHGWSTTYRDTRLIVLGARPLFWVCLLAGIVAGVVL